MTSTRLLSKKLILLWLLVFQLFICANSAMPVYAAEPEGTDTEQGQGTESAVADDPEINPVTDESAVPDPEEKTASPDENVANTAVNIDIIQQTLESLRSEIENSKESANLNKGSVQSMKDGLDLIESKLKDAYAALDQSRTGITGNAEKIDELKKSLLASARDVRTNSSDLASQKSLIEDNSIRLYELLIQLDTINEQVRKFNAQIQTSKNSGTEDTDIKLVINGDLKKIWMILVTALVFLVPLAFSFPRGNSKKADEANLHQGIVVACLFAIFGYFVIGFSLMYGTSSSGWLGISYLVPGGTNGTEGLEPAFHITQFMPYQAGFIILATLIISTTIGARLSTLRHAGLAFFAGALLIPVYGHWVWASRFTPGNKGWLEGAGFVDQSGASVISVVAACFALVLFYRLSRHTPADPHPEQAQHPIYSAVAVLFLWLSWLGFTTGHLSLSADHIPTVVLNALVAAVMAGIAAFLPYAFFSQEKISIARGLAGFVSGLVAIAACGQSVTFMEAAVIGIGAGILLNLAFNFLRKLFLPHDHHIRAAYLITIHGVAGIWGTLCVALLGTDGNFGSPNIIQLMVQVQGLAAAIAYSMVMAYIAGFLLTFRKKSTRKALVNSGT